MVMKMPSLEETLARLVTGTVAEDAGLVGEVCERTVLDDETARAELIGLRAAATWLTREFLGEEVGAGKVPRETLLLLGIDEKQARVVAERRLPYAAAASVGRKGCSQELEDAWCKLVGDVSLLFGGNGAKNVGVLFAHYCNARFEPRLERLGATVFADTCREVRQVVIASGDVRSSASQGRGASPASSGPGSAPMGSGNGMNERPTVNTGFVAARVIAAVVALVGVGGLPYGYYVLLRWVVSPVAAYTALEAAKMPRKGWSWVFGVLALVFNPILPVHLTREVWPLVDLAACVLLLASLVTVKAGPVATGQSGSIRSGPC